MTFRIDEKGKYFTDHITKRSLPVTLCVRDRLIHGVIHLTGENRLKDELNDGETFVAITDAQVCQPDSTETLYETEVLIVQKAHIAWVFPREDAPPPEVLPPNDAESVK